MVHVINTMRLPKSHSVVGDIFREGSVVLIMINVCTFR